MDPSWGIEVLVFLALLAVGHICWHPTVHTDTYRQRSRNNMVGSTRLGQRESKHARKVSNEKGSSCPDHQSGKWFLGSIRISKTGSTSLEHVLQNAFNDVYRLPHFLPVSQNAGGSLEDTDTESQYHIDNCFYGYGFPSSSIPTKGNPQRGGSCVHVDMPDVLDYFRYRAPTIRANIVEEPQPELQMFTMIRDPFDHLASYFYYSSEIYPGWKSQHTAKQNECVVAKDFACWLMHLNLEGSPISSIPDQFGQLSPSINEAMRLMTPAPKSNGSVARLPNVIVLINECFETSVRLLVDLVPQVFNGDDVERCHSSRPSEEVLERLDDFLLNRSQTLQRVTLIKRQEKEKNSTQWNALREQAKLWFADDYTFYKASLRQFQLLLNQSSLKGPHIDECNAKLISIVAAK